MDIDIQTQKALYNFMAQFLTEDKKKNLKGL